MTGWPKISENKKANPNTAYHVLAKMTKITQGTDRYAKRYPDSYRADNNKIFQNYPYPIGKKETKATEAIPKKNKSQIRSKGKRPRGGTDMRKKKKDEGESQRGSKEGKKEIKESKKAKVRHLRIYFHLQLPSRKKQTNTPPSFVEVRYAFI